MKLLTAMIVSAALSVPIACIASPIAVSGTDGVSVRAGSTGTIVATYLGHSAWYSNDLYLVTDDGIDGNDILIFNNHASAVGSVFNLGSFRQGSELIFRMHVNNTGYDVYSGAASRNADNRFHARVQHNWMPNTTLVSFEDLLGGRFDFNDLSFSFSQTAVPEPVSILLFGAGLAGLAAMRRRAGIQ